MLEACRKRGLFIAVDEIQDIDMEELRALGNAVQLVIREEGNIAFAFAGLPSAIDKAVNHPGTTFLQRAASIELLRLEDFEVEGSFEETMASTGMEIPHEQAAALAKATGGHPFMVQLVGFYTWRNAYRGGAHSVSEEDVSKGIAYARKGFTSSVIKPVIARLSILQKEYLAAMARVADDTGSARRGQVAQEAGRDVTALAGVRKSLIDAGILESPGFGEARFAVPYLREYLLQNS